MWGQRERGEGEKKDGGAGGEDGGGGGGKGIGRTGGVGNWEKSMQEHKI